MEIRINDQPHAIPTDLSQITVAQFLEYQEKWGSELNKQFIAILHGQYSDEFDRELDLSDHVEKEGIAWFSFFSGYDFNQLSKEDLIPIHTLYRKIKILLNESERECQQFPSVIEWNSELWEIKSYESSETGTLSLQEYSASKQVACFVRKLETGHWEALPYLCAILFRKKGEAYQDDFISEDSDRLQLMHTLPMSIALQVAYFVAIALNFWNKTVGLKEKISQ